jgi:predicted AlkP superfamily phosphohydrolase/phosphomutase
MRLTQFFPSFKVKRALSLALTLLIFCSPDLAQAYIGPGAGFAFLGSTFVFVLTILMAAGTLLLWPLLFLWRKLRGKGISKHARARRVIVVGLDGLEPKITEQMMEQGDLPHLQALAQVGGYRRLGTTLPPLSPVAWSTFQTGVNPGAHNIFDFLSRDKRTCLPELSSTSTQKSSYRFAIGPFKFGSGRAKVVIARKSKPFWKVLGEYGVISNIIRIPISYPPEKFEGNILSAMCTPDLRGSQGSFSFFTTRNDIVQARAGGEFRLVTRSADTIICRLEGPPHPYDTKKEALSVVFSLKVDEAKKSAVLQINKQSLILLEGQFSEWVELQFAYGFRKSIKGIVRFCLREVGSQVSLYVSPINVHPESPALPIAEPIIFSSWLAKENGLYGTLGLMEDTWGRNELALDDERFLQQAYLTHAEREKMFFETLARTPEGVCACVFDASDRIQHMFWRYIDPKHPSPREHERFESVIPDMYRNMDQLIGRVVAKLKPEDLLIVLSDHGFSSFRRGLNLNTWLEQNGYLVLKPSGRTGADYFQDVDWSKTRAFGCGLTGIYINQKDRERTGIVDVADSEALLNKIISELEPILDPQDGARAIRKIYQSKKVYKGLYTDEAPDLIIGYEPGYRVSWDSVTGVIEEHVFSDNTKAWSGDHQVDPTLIPGVLFSNRPISSDSPHIVDMAPSILNTFAVPVPRYMEGKVVF